MSSAGRITHVPLHYLKVYNPDNIDSEGQKRGGKLSEGGLTPRNFRDVITMDISASTNGPLEVEENMENETELETMETPAEAHMEPQKKGKLEDAP